MANIYIFKISFVYLKPSTTSFITCLLHVHINPNDYFESKTVLNAVLKLVDKKNQMRIKFNLVK